MSLESQHSGKIQERAIAQKYHSTHSSQGDGVGVGVGCDADDGFCGVSDVSTFRKKTSEIQYSCLRLRVRRPGLLGLMEELQEACCL